MNKIKTGLQYGLGAAIMIAVTIMLSVELGDYETPGWLVAMYAFIFLPTMAVIIGKATINCWGKADQLRCPQIANLTVMIVTAVTISTPAVSALTLWNIHN